MAKRSRKKERTGKWVFMILLGFMLWGAAGAVAYLFMDKVPTSAAASPTGKTKLTAPEKLGELPKVSDASLSPMIDSTQAQLGQSIPGSTGALAAAYGDVATSNVVLVFAVAAPVPDPAKQLDSVMTGLAPDEAVSKTIVAVPAGPLGGVAKCGTDQGEVKLSFCAWTDKGSIGLVMWLNKSLDQAKADFGNVRGQVQVKA